jgi:hypothetical protein
MDNGESYMARKLMAAQVLSHQRQDARFAHRGPAGAAPGAGSRKKNAQGLQNSKVGGRGPEGLARNG